MAPGVVDRVAPGPSLLDPEEVAVELGRDGLALDPAALVEGAGVEGLGPLALAAQPAGPLLDPSGLQSVSRPSCSCRPAHWAKVGLCSK